MGSRASAAACHRISPNECAVCFFALHFVTHQSSNRGDSGDILSARERRTSISFVVNLQDSAEAVLQGWGTADNMCNIWPQRSSMDTTEGAGQRICLRQEVQQDAPPRAQQPSFITRSWAGFADLPRNCSFPPLDPQHLMPGLVGDNSCVCGAQQRL